MSSAEAENAVYSSCAKEVKFISQLLADLGVEVPKPIIIWCDNSAAVSTITNVGATARTRHYDRWVHYGREQYLDNFSKPSWLPTNVNVSDIFTKPLDKHTFFKFRAALLNFNHELVPTDLSDKIY